MSDISPIVIYTNLFTLKGKDVKLNRYVDMFYIWVYNIIKYGKLAENDYCITFMDNITFEHIKTSNMFNWIISKIKNFRVILYHQPDTIKQGILQRYYIDDILKVTDSISLHNPYYLHLDIDVLVINDIRKLFEKNLDNNKTTIYLKSEDLMIDSNYYGELITEEERTILKEKGLLNMPGFSAGIYAWKNSKDIRKYFEFILYKANNTEKTLYTVEQPFFNAAIFNYLFKKQGIFNFFILDDELTGHNRYYNQVSDKAVLLNFCGIPGDDSFHWDKILTNLLLSSLT